MSEQEKLRESLIQTRAALAIAIWLLRKYLPDHQWLPTLQDRHEDAVKVIHPR